jgi:hypothetical protein
MSKIMTVFGTTREQGDDLIDYTLSRYMDKCHG